MTIKKMISAITAAATLSSCTAMMAISANAETEESTVAIPENALGVANFIGMIGANGCWGVDEVNELSTYAVIDGNAQYEVVWDVSATGGTDTLQFLAIQINAANDVTGFTSDVFPALEVTIDEVWIDDVLVEDYTTSADAINTQYYETTGVTRMYLHDQWAGTGTADLPASTVILDNLRVKFTVSGLYNDGTSNVTPDPEPPAYTLGDVDSDGAINAVDASMILKEYAVIATGEAATFTATQALAADVNYDTAIDAIDASSILAYYAYTATGGTDSLETFLG